MSKLTVTLLYYSRWLLSNCGNRFTIHLVETLEVQAQPPAPADTTRSKFKLCLSVHLAVNGCYIVFIWSFFFYLCRLLLPYECHVKGISIRSMMPHHQLKPFHFVAGYSKEEDDGVQRPAKRRLVSIPVYQVGIGFYWHTHTKNYNKIDLLLCID